MSLGLSLFDCCVYETGPCTITITVRGCGVNLEGYDVSIWYGPLVGVGTTETKVTNAEGQVTFTVPESGGYSFYVSPPVGADFNGYELDGFPVVCPGNNSYLIELFPVYGSGCTDCGPVPMPQNLTLAGFPGMDAAYSTTGPGWVVDFPLVDCPEHECPGKEEGTFGPGTTRIFFSMFCQYGVYYLQMQWLTYGHLNNPYGEPPDHEFDVFYYCPFEWAGGEIPAGFPGDLKQIALGFFASNSIAGSGPFAVTFDAVFYSGIPGIGVPVTDPFIKLFCVFGTPTPFVVASS